MGGKFDTIHGPTLAIPFTFTNATTGESDSDFTFAGGAGSLVPQPVAGSVVGVGIRASAAITAGTMTVKVHKDGTEYPDESAPAPALDSDAQESYASVRPSVLTFAAGEAVGLSLTTTTTLDATNTLDIDGLLYIQLDPNA